MYRWVSLALLVTTVAFSHSAIADDSTASRCDRFEWGGDEALLPLLEEVRIVRRQLSGPRALEKLEALQGRITAKAKRRAEPDLALQRQLTGCSDDPTGQQRAAPGQSYVDEEQGLALEITDVADAGRSGRGWPGVRCAYRVRDVKDPEHHATLDAPNVPDFNELAQVIRQDNAVFAAVHYNGYAKEIGGRGNRVLGLDLCEQAVKWSSKDLVSNGPVLLYGDYLITAYGFTAEPDYLYVLDAHTGRTVQKLPLPKAVRALALAEDRLFALIYNGFVVYRLLR